MGAVASNQTPLCSSSPGAAFFPLPLRLAGLPDASLSLLLAAAAFFLAFFLAAFADWPLSLSLSADLYSESGSDSEAGSDAEPSPGEELLRRFGMCAD